MTHDRSSGRDLLSVADLSADEVGRVFATAAALKAEFRATRRHALPPLRRADAGDAVPEAEPADAGHVRGRDGPARRARDLPDPRRRARGARERAGRGPQPRAVRRRRSSCGPGRTRSRSSSRRRPSIPVINGLTLREHPCQALADVFTMHERFGRLDGLVVAFVGDGNNVYHSLALLGAALGMEVRLAHPAGYAPNERIVARAAELAAASGGRLTSSVTTRSRRSAAPRSSTPTPGPRWARRPRPRSAATRSPGFRVDDALLDAAGTDVVAMHCLPAHRGEEITSAVMDGPRSLIWEQSENRLHVQKALLVELLGRDRRRMSEAALRAVQGRAPARPRRGAARAARRGRGGLSRGDAARAGPGAAVRRPRRRRSRSSAGPTTRSPPIAAPSTGRRPTRARCAAGRTCWRPPAGARRPPTTSTGWPAILERDGRLADACDVARRALELAESRGRRRQAARTSSARLRGVRDRRCRPRPRPSIGRWASSTRCPSVGTPTRRTGRATAGLADAAAARPAAADARGRGGARGRRPRRGAPARPRRGGRPSRRRPVPRRDGRLLPGARDRAVRPGHPPAARRAVPRSRLARSGGRQARPARPADAADRRRGDAGSAVRARRRPASPTTRGSRALCA